MTPEEIERAYQDWENVGDHDPVESSDNYYWAGASSFKDFLVSVAEKMRKLTESTDSM